MFCEIGLVAGWMLLSDILFGEGETIEEESSSSSTLVAWSAWDEPRQG